MLSDGQVKLLANANRLGKPFKRRPGIEHRPLTLQLSNRLAHQNTEPVWKIWTGC